MHSVGGDWQAVRSGGCLDESQCESLLRMELETAAANERRIFGDTCACVEAALTDMTYNLGAHGIGGFSHMIAAVKAGDWSGAAAEAVDSSWCRCVVRRAPPRAAGRSPRRALELTPIARHRRARASRSQVKTRCDRDTSILRNGC